MENFETYLQPTEFFNFNKKFVSDMAFEITAGLETESDKAKALFYWVRDNIKYNMHTYIPSVKANFKASVTLRRRNGFCVSKSVLLSSFARAIGIPARIHLVDLINHKISQKIVEFMGTNVMHYHGYSELYLNNKWVKLTPSFDQKTALKGGFFPMVEFDGENNATFASFDNDGNKFGEYVKDRGVHADLPLKDIEIVFNEKYPKFSQLRNGQFIMPVKDKTLTYK